MKFFIGEWYSDLAILECYMRTIKTKTSTDRLRKFKIKNSVGYSATYGVVKKKWLSATTEREYCEKTGLYKTTLYSDRPELMEVFTEFRDIYFRDFEFNSIQLNKNYALGRHRDRGNNGNSVLVACGDYSGGATVVEYENEIKKYDARLNPIIFDGCKYYHYVEPFVGDRYSLVFYKF